MEPGKKQELELQARDFFNSHKKEISNALKGNAQIVKIDYEIISQFSPILAEKLIEEPEMTINLLENALEETGLVKSPRLRLNTLPNLMNVTSIRSKDIDTLVSVEGIISKVSDLKIKSRNIRFECKLCGAIFWLDELEKLLEPSQCSSCKRKGPFRPVTRMRTDCKDIEIKDAKERDNKGNKVKILAPIDVELTEDLVAPNTDSMLQEGNKVRIIGVVKSNPLTIQGKKQVNEKIRLVANNIILLSQVND